MRDLVLLIQSLNGCSGWAWVGQECGAPPGSPMWVGLKHVGHLPLLSQAQYPGAGRRWSNQDLNWHLKGLVLQVTVNPQIHKSPLHHLLTKLSFIQCCVLLSLLEFIWLRTCEFVLGFSDSIGLYVCIPVT